MDRDREIVMNVRKLTCWGLSLVLALVFCLTSGLGMAPAWAGSMDSDTGILIAAVGDEDVPEPRKILETKIDVNNTILRNYRKLPGFYPTLARTLILNSPYDSLDELLEIEGLTEAQKELIRSNFVNLTLGEYREGDSQRENMINKGYYG